MREGLSPRMSTRKIIVEARIAKMFLKNEIDKPPMHQAYVVILCGTVILCGSASLSPRISNAEGGPLSSSFELYVPERTVGRLRPVKHSKIV